MGFSTTIRAVKLSFLLILYLFITTSWAQDEREFRKFLMGDFGKESAKKREKVFIRGRTAFYELDLDGNNRNERLFFEKRNSEDWLVIEDYDKKEIYRYRFTPTGVNSTVFRLNIRNISTRTKVLIFHYFEGEIEGFSRQSTARYYFLTMDDLDLKSLSMYRGPQFWEERDPYKGNYFNRKYHLALFDYNGDGVKEVTVKHHLITSVFRYKGQGNWISFTGN